MPSTQTKMVRHRSRFIWQCTWFNVKWYINVVQNMLWLHFKMDRVRALELQIHPLLSSYTQKHTHTHTHAYATKQLCISKRLWTCTSSTWDADHITCHDVQVHFNVANITRRRSALTESVYVDIPGCECSKRRKAKSNSDVSSKFYRRFLGYLVILITLIEADWVGKLFQINPVRPQFPFIQKILSLIIKCCWLSSCFFFLKSTKIYSYRLCRNSFPSCIYIKKKCLHVP